MKGTKKILDQDSIELLNVLKENIEAILIYKDMRVGDFYKLCGMNISSHATIFPKDERYTRNIGIAVLTKYYVKGAKLKKDKEGSEYREVLVQPYELLQPGWGRSLIIAGMKEGVIPKSDRLKKEWNILDSDIEDNRNQEYFH